MNFKALKKKTSSKFSKVYYLQNCCIRYYTFYYHCYLALFKLLFVELGFRQINIKYILYYYTTILIYSGSNAVID